MLYVLLLCYAVAGDLNRPFHSCVQLVARPLNENEARVNFVLIETSLLSLIYATQDSRMTKMACKNGNAQSCATFFGPVVQSPIKLILG